MVLLLSSLLLRHNKKYHSGCRLKGAWCCVHVAKQALLAIINDGFPFSSSASNIMSQKRQAHSNRWAACASRPSL